MFGRRGRLAALEARVKALEAALKERRELPTVAGFLAVQDEQPMSTARIMDEWFNGKENGDDD